MSQFCAAPIRSEPTFMQSSDAENVALAQVWRIQRILTAHPKPQPTKTGSLVLIPSNNKENRILSAHPKPQDL